MSIIKYIPILIIFCILFLFNVYAQDFPGSDTVPLLDPESYDWNTQPISTISPFSPEYLQYVPPARRSELTSQQLVTIPPQDLGDLGVYNPVQLSTALQAQGYDVTVSGDLAGAAVQGDSIILTDGSRISLAGLGLSVDVTGGKVTLSSPDVTIEGGTGVIYTLPNITVASALSSYFGKRYSQHL